MSRLSVVILVSMLSTGASAAAPHRPTTRPSSAGLTVATVEAAAPNQKSAALIIKAEVLRPWCAEGQ